MHPASRGLALFISYFNTLLTRPFYICLGDCHKQFLTKNRNGGSTEDFEAEATITGTPMLNVFNEARS